MNDELVKQVVDQLTPILKELITEEFKDIHKRLDTIEETLDLWKLDLDDDRDNLRGIRIEAAQLNAEMKEVGISVDKLPKKIEKTIEETVKESVQEEIPQAVNDTFDVVGNSVTVTEKPRWYHIFRGRG